MIKVLIVDDSRVAQELLRHIFESDGDIKVVDVVGNGRDAAAAVARTRPDVITMDVNMPQMNGFEATRQIMETYPTPIIIVSASVDPHELVLTFQAMEAGAVSIQARPPGPDHPEHEPLVRTLVDTVKLMAEVKVVRRWPRTRPIPPPLSLPERDVQSPKNRIRVVAIGASTGGPMALHTLLGRLPADFPLPVLVVQHISPGFIEGFVHWLNQGSPLTVRSAQQGEPLLPGTVYIAPDDYHLGVTPDKRVQLSNSPAENGSRPAVSYLFRSVNAAYGSAAVGILLSGMGKDGAVELRQMRESGAITLVQDKATSVVHGMAGEAMRLDGATHVLPIQEIGTVLVRIVTPRLDSSK